MRHRLVVTWGAILAASGLLGCAGKATERANENGTGGAQGGNAGAGAGAGNAHGGNGGNGGSVSGGAGEDEHESGGVGGEGTSDAQLLIASAWDVTLSAVYTDGEGPDLSLPPLSLAVLDYAGALVGILSRDGYASSFALTRESPGSARLEAPNSDVTFSLDGSSSVQSLVLQTLTLTAFDDDSDGVADRLVGTGDGAAEISCGDCFYSKPVSLTLSGKPDRTPPRLDVLDMNKDLNPIDVLAIKASEALKSATLTLTGSSTLPLSVDDSNAPLTVFSNPEVLPFSGAWKVTGVGQDFAGQLLDSSSANITTLADPGVFAQDGFETQPNVVLSGRAAVVDASSGLPIPNGDRALLLPPGSAATFHLQRTAANSTVSARLVSVDVADGSGAWVNFDSAVIGGTQRTRDFSVPGPGLLPTSHPVWTTASEASTVQFALKEAGSDVVVRIAAADCTVGLCQTPGALLVDELKLE